MIVFKPRPPQDEWYRVELVVDPDARVLRPLEAVDLQAVSLEEAYAIAQKLYGDKYDIRNVQLIANELSQSKAVPVIARREES